MLKTKPGSRSKGRGNRTKYIRKKITRAMKRKKPDRFPRWGLDIDIIVNISLFGNMRFMLYEIVWIMVQIFGR